MVPELYCKVTTSLRESQHYILTTFQSLCIHDITLFVHAHMHLFQLRLFSLSLTPSLLCLFILVQTHTHTHSMHMQKRDKYWSFLGSDNVFMQNETPQHRLGWQWFIDIRTHIHTLLTQVLLFRWGWQSRKTDLELLNYSKARRRTWERWASWKADALLCNCNVTCYNVT